MWGPIIDDENAHVVPEETLAAGVRVEQRRRYTGVDGHVRGVDSFRVRDGRVAVKRSHVKG